MKYNILTLFNGIYWQDFEKKPVAFLRKDCGINVTFTKTTLSVFLQLLAPLFKI
jgi:hypothetical protein